MSVVYSNILWTIFFGGMGIPVLCDVLQYPVGPHINRIYCCRCKNSSGTKKANSYIPPDMSPGGYWCGQHFDYQHRFPIFWLSWMVGCERRPEIAARSFKWNGPCPSRLVMMCFGIYQKVQYTEYKQVRIIALRMLCYGIFLVWSKLHYAQPFAEWHQISSRYYW